MRFEDVDWEQASCRGVFTDLFYLETSYEAFVVNPQLRRMCAACPILDQCRDYAIRNENYGFWGGLTVQERHRLRARMNRSNRAA